MAKPAVHAFRDDALANHDGVGLAALIRDGTLKPEEVIEAAIARAELMEPSISAIVVDCFEEARRRSVGVLSGAIAGVPTFIKDMTDVAGLPTRRGSEAFHRAEAAPRNHPIAQQYLDMGMVCLGKSAMTEFGFTPSVEPPNGEPTRNPWNLDRSAGGSSGGSAALVASGVVPIANAADGGGSIRIPAACCGLVGLKPSRGRLPNSQGHEPIIGTVVEGVVTRSVRDTALFMAEAEKLHPNANLLSIGHVERPLDRPLRIGAMTTPPMPVEVDAATRQELETALVLLESLGHHVEPIDPPVSERFVDDFIVMFSMFAFLATATAKRMVDPTFDRSRLTPITDGLCRDFRRSILKAPGAIARLRRSGRESAALFSEFDIIASPTVATLPPPIGYLGEGLPHDVLFPRVRDWASFTGWANATGAPSISLPLGHDGASNLPVGVMFGADLGNEQLLLQLALQLEAATSAGSA